MRSTDNFIRAIDVKLIYAIGCITSILIFFQASFMFDKFHINLNLADMLSICGISIVFIRRHHNNQLQFNLPYVQSFILASTLAFATALIIGWHKFGFSTFAFFNKFLGLFILFGYAAVGALFIHGHGIRGLRVLTRIMLTVLATLIAYELFINILYSSHILETAYLNDLSLAGYANNRNAFAFQIMCALCLQFTLKEIKNSWITSLLLSGIILTYSRSAIITTFILVNVFYYFKFITTAELKKYLYQIIVITVSVLLIENAAYYILEFFRNVFLGIKTEHYWTILSNKNFSPATSNSQRMYTILEGFKLWKENPFFGIGLGGFVNLELQKNNAFLVIHNSFLWILTEFGIFGASVFLLYGLVILKHMYSLLKQKAFNWPTQDRIVLGLLIVFGLMANAHEVFYQRIFWFLIGAAIVSYKRTDKHLSAV